MMRGMGEGNFLKKVPLSNPCSGFGWRGGLLRMEGKREGMESKAPVWS